jgi:predicted dehydrogenase
MMHRRRFLKSAAAAIAAVTIVPRHTLGGPRHTAPSDRLAVAGIGVGGQGGGVCRGMAGLNTVDIVALADVDWKYAADTFRFFEKAERFRDFRVLLEKRKDVEAVVIGTPDHWHAPITLAALKAGKHVYVEKPMAHSIEEARVMTQVAKETGLVTQMGNGGHGGEGLRLTREWILAGAIGTVREVHSWSDRPGNWWKQDLERPTDTPAVPAECDWNLWLGGAPERPYHPTYHPKAWRGWFDFGTGALGDMAIHNMDPAFYALDLDPPVATEARTSPLKKESYPAWTVLTYEFAAKGSRPAVKVFWHDGGKMPPVPADLGSEDKLSDNGIYFVGEKGTMVCGGWSGAPKLYPAKRREEFQTPPATIPRSIGHHQEWIKASKERKPEDSKAGFAYSGPFTEGLLVGNLALRLGKRIEWDTEAMKARNAPEADRLIRKTYRAGFGI